MANIGGNLKRLREAAGMTQLDLAKRLKCQKQTISNYERNRREPDLETIALIADILGVTVETIMREEKRPTSIFMKNDGIPQSFVNPFPDPLISEMNSRINKRMPDLIPEPVLPANAIPYTPGRAMVPVIGTVRCGPGGLAFEELQGAEMADVANPAEYFFLRVEGDSMAPAIEAGDTALIHIQPEVENGQLAVVIIDGEEGMLKKFMREGNTVILQSFNPAYAPRVLVGEEINTMCIAGKVVETRKQW